MLETGKTSKKLTFSGYFRGYFRGCHTFPTPLSLLHSFDLETGISWFFPESSVDAHAYACCSVATEWSAAKADIWMHNNNQVHNVQFWCYWLILYAQLIITGKQHLQIEKLIDLFFII